MNAETPSDPVVVSAARWFWWIAGLSLVNTVLFYMKSDTSFVIGLGLTTVASVFFQMTVALVFIVATLAFYAYIGYVAQRGVAWAFYIGLAVYVFDALIFVYFEDWMSVAFHGLAIFFIMKGVMQLREAPKPAA
ncbi:MAG TPA: hypothetical protein VIA80_01120 [Hyphomonadaceae bacterium]|jgi:hypothetical protein